MNIFFHCFNFYFFYYFFGKSFILSRKLKFSNSIFVIISKLSLLYNLIKKNVRRDDKGGYVPQRIWDWSNERPKGRDETKDQKKQNKWNDNVTKDRSLQKRAETQIFWNQSKWRKSLGNLKNDTYHCTSTKDFIITGKERERDAESVKPLGIWKKIAPE